MINELKFFIPGIPKPKQSVRVNPVYRNGEPVTFTDEKTGRKRILLRKHPKQETIDHERSIQMIIREQLPAGFKPVDEPIRVVKLHYIFPPVSSLRKAERQIIDQGGLIPKTTKPDLPDNLQKALFDAMEGIVFTNDSRIFELNRTGKYYGSEPGIRLILQYGKDQKVKSNELNLFS